MGFGGSRAAFGIGGGAAVILFGIRGGAFLFQFGLFLVITGLQALAGLVVGGFF